MDWGINPTTVQAVASLAGLLLLIFGGWVALRQLNAAHKSRNAQLLMSILRDLNEAFIEDIQYKQLKRDAESGKNLDWSQTMDEAHASLYRTLQMYDVIGRLIDRKMIDEDLAVGYVAGHLMVTYRDMKPIFDRQMNADYLPLEGLRSLIERCQK